MKYYKSLLLFTIIFTFGCESETLSPSLCLDGNCDGSLSIPGYVDANGYYHIDLDFTGEYYPRFSIYVEADDVDPYYYYNDMGVVQAAFESPSNWTLPSGEILEIVQSTTIYLNNSPDNTEYLPNVPGRKWAKRIIGPIPPMFEGDTLRINAEIYWDGGSKTQSQYFSERIIVE